MRPLFHAAVTLTYMAAPFALSSAAVAQLQLPGASSGSAVGGVSGGSAGESTAGVPVRAPGEGTIVGRELRLNGARGALFFEMRDKQLALTSLSVLGEKISKRGDLCQVDVPDAPFTARALPRADGLRRYEVAVPGCTFTMEVLDSAVQINIGDATSSAALGGTCDFVAADCRAAMAGVWGPNASALGAEIKNIEHVRSTAEKNARANFRALLAAAGRDKLKVRLVASEQAGFSSRRAEQCEDYAGEAVHGFCASRVTEAWAIALRARLNPAAFEAEDSAPAKKQPGRKQPPATTTPKAPQTGGPQAEGAPAGGLLGGSGVMPPPLQANQFR